MKSRGSVLGATGVALISIYKQENSHREPPAQSASH